MRSYKTILKDLEENFGDCDRVDEIISEMAEGTSVVKFNKVFTVVEEMGHNNASESIEKIKEILEESE